MDKQKHRKYITEKYNVSLVSYLAYSTIDSMKVLIDSLTSENLFLKGAANLMFNYDYKRENLTKDIDFSIVGDLNDTVNKLNDHINQLENDIYSFEVLNTVDLSISVNDYNGKRINIISVLKNSKTTFNFSIDLAIEEYTTPNGLKLVNGLLVYTIERTLADKFVTFIQRGEGNSREKDFIDFAFLYKSCNKAEFIAITKSLLEKRNVTKELVDEFTNGFEEYKYVQKHSLHTDLWEVLKMINN